MTLGNEQMTSEQFQRRFGSSLQPPPETGRAKRKGKYDAVPTVWRGRRYDSKGEASYAMHLETCLATGIYATVLRQVPIDLGPDERVTVDWVAHYGEESPLAGGLVAIEFKGMETPRFRQVRRLWAKYGPFDMLIVKGSETKLVYETIPGGGA